ncbi:Hypothetical_protein [Hexamita inflata]|uniref:Hypothetical_protein n=1 Tax=Hexamita inflata TaxID=28002 RepID=A0AA86NAT4_9EUKA|nr:Hypothetical protein HINF_LOCUS3545 [Hexamita inflata]
MRKVPLDLKLISCVESTVYIVYLYLLYKIKYDQNLVVSLKLTFFVLVSNQLLVLSTVIFVVTKCEASGLVRIFNLLSCLMFCAVSQIIRVLFYERVRGTDYMLMRYPGLLIAGVYLYRIVKYVMLLTQFQGSNNLQIYKVQ